MNKNLSSRELEILKLVANEKTSKQIAEELDISKRTVDRHRYQICKKVGITGNHSLLKYAITNRERILAFIIKSNELFE